MIVSEKARTNREKNLRWDEEEFNNISNLIESKEELSHYEFLRIRNFKIDLSSRENEENIQKITKIAFEFAKRDEIIPAIESLEKNLNGIGISIASAILAMRFPKNFAIIDRKVIKQLKKEEEFKDYKTSSATYKKYLLLMRENAKNKNKALRDYERELYEKD